ncbi:CNDH2 protein, partial [Thryothorus ludovicianus]|nr:CNDH2 protein [Thryothorus ludovicianus]
MEEVDSRFLHLLQPIRDLTENWQVDVASQLGEYLDELDQICISFDNGKTTMNFMEAALLIQGSACVYSRKVEYLYMLVYQALDLISNKKREKLPLGPENRDGDATFAQREEDVRRGPCSRGSLPAGVTLVGFSQQFLSLDDTSEPSQACMGRRRDQQPAAVHILPLMPMSLVPPDEEEKKDKPLLSQRGEVLASRRDFRMNTSVPHASGAFLLDLDELSLSLLQQEQPLGTATGTGGTLGCLCHRHCHRQELTWPCPLAAAPGPGAAERASADLGTALPQALSFSEEAEPDDDDVPEALGVDMEVTPAPKEHIQAQRSTPQPRGYVLRERAPIQHPKSHSKEEPNPWQSLDPFEESEEKPFRKGRPFQVPPGLDDIVGNKRKKRGPRKLQDFARWFSAAYNVTEVRKSRRRGPTFADLELLYWQQYKERLAAHRQLQSWREPLKEPELELELEQECGTDSEEGEDGFAEHEDMEPEAPEELGEGSLDTPEPSYAELVRRNVELFMASSQKFTQETELSQRIRLWEERLEPLLQEQ